MDFLLSRPQFDTSKSFKVVGRERLKVFLNLFIALKRTSLHLNKY